MMFGIAPPSAGAAGQHAAGSHRQAQLLAVHLSAEAAHDALVQHVAQHAGLKACCIAVDEEEQRLVAEHLGAGVHQAEELVLQLPHLAGGAPAIGGRVHDDGIVLPAPAQISARV